MAHPAQRKLSCLQRRRLHRLLHQLGGALLYIGGRLLLLPEVLLEQVHRFILAHLLRADDQGPVASDLEVLDLCQRRR